MKDHARFAILRLLGQVQVLIGQAVVALTRGIRPSPPSVILRWHPTSQSYFEAAMARITNEQRVRISVNPKTAGGRPANIDGEVQFASSDTAVATVERIDATSAWVKGVGEGAAQITAEFDADLGEGVRNVTASGALEVVAAEAESGEIVFGEPELAPIDPPVDPTL